MGLFGALRPEARENSCPRANIYAFISLGHNWHVSWVLKWPRHCWQEWVTLNEKPVWWDTLPEAKNLCLNCFPKDWTYEKRTPLQQQSPWLRNGSSLTRLVHGEQGWNRKKAKTWSAMERLVTFCRHVRIIPWVCFFYPETILIYSITLQGAEPVWEWNEEGRNGGTKIVPPATDFCP